MADSRPALLSATRRLVGDARLARDPVGESPAQVYRFTRGNEVFFLKTISTQYTSTTYSAWREGEVLQWLASRLPVPEVILVERSDEMECLVTRAVPGRPLSQRIADGRPVVAYFAEAIRLVQGVDVRDCPLRADIAVRLPELERLVVQGLVADDGDLSRWPGLDSPAAFIAHLWRTAPVEELVFSHGDLCDSNVFVDERDRLHVIDWGRGGVADRWIDIAFAHRNLREDVSETAAAALLAAMPWPDAPHKREYFEQLDELF